MFKNKLGKELSLRDYQQAIKRRIFDAWRNQACVMVQMPTGTGKTHLLASVIYDLLSTEPEQCVWIIAHRRELVEQIASNPQLSSSASFLRLNVLSSLN